MNPDDQEIRILNFLEQHVGNQLGEFLFDYRIRIQKDTKKKRPDIDIDELGGDALPQKRQSLIKKWGKGDKLGEFSFYLAAYWIEKLHHPPKPLIEAGIHEDITVYGQDLWKQEQTREMAIQVFDCLALNFDKSFAQEWAEVKDVLAAAPSLGEIKALPDLTRHFADCRQLYNEATTQREARQWVEARTTYLKLDKRQPGFRDAPAWANKLESKKDVAQLQKVINIAEQGFIFDERLPLKTPQNPYLLLQAQTGTIMLEATMQEIETAVNHLDDLSPTDRSSLDSLLTTESRLFVDAFLFPAEQVFKAVDQLEALFLERDGRMPPATDIQTEFAVDVPILYILLDDPDQATNFWWNAQQEKLRSGRLAHYQALLYLAQACDPQLKDLETVVEKWEQAIAYWALALTDTVYWLTWGQQRGSVYGTKVIPAVITNLHNALEGHLSRQLADRQAAAKDPDWSAAFARLYRALVAEFKAVRLLKALGGIPLDGGQVVWFGPLGMHYLGQQEALSHYLATVRLTPWQTDTLPEITTEEEALRQLRWYFSYMKTAVVLLDDPATDPSIILKALEASSYRQTASCADPLCLQHGEKLLPFPVPCPNTVPFPDQNPAYAQLENRSQQLRDDLLFLALDVYLRQAQTLTNEGDLPDLDALQTSWKKALDLAKAANHHPEAVEQIQKMVLAAGAGQISNMGRLNTAVLLFDLARRLVPERDDKLTHRLAELLYQRGASKQQNRDWLGAEQDLNRALTLVPANIIYRQQLAALWILQAGSIVFKEHFRALDFLRRAEELIDEGRQKFPGANFNDSWSIIQKTKNSLGFAPNPTKSDDPFAELDKVLPEESLSEPVRLYSQCLADILSGHPEVALNRLEPLLPKNPDGGELDELLQKAAAEAVVARAARFINEDNQRGGINLIEKWQPWLPTQKTLEEQLLFLRCWPDLRALLRKVNDRIDFPYTVHNFQEVHIPFQAEGGINRIVRLHVEEDTDRLLFTGKLPLFLALEAEQVKYNFLQLSRRMSLIKVIPADNGQLSLQASIPFRLLVSAVTFIRTVFWVNQCIAVPHDQLTQLDKLQAWLQMQHEQLFAQEADMRSSYEQTIVTLFREKNIGCELIREFQHRITTAAGQAELSIQIEGIHFSLTVGKLAKDKDGLGPQLDALITHNARLKDAKLALGKNDEILLSVELPSADEGALLEAIERLGQASRQLPANLMTHQET